MRKILILSPDDQFAQRLFAMLVEMDDYSVSLTSMMREAALILTEQEHDLVFLPLANHHSLIPSLRSLQADLRIVVIVDSPTAELSPMWEDQVHGVLAKSRLQVDLPALMESVWAQLVLPESMVGEQAVDRTKLTAILQKGIVGQEIITSLLAREATLLAHAGTLNEQQAAVIARQIQHSWATGTQTAQVRFVQLPDRSSDLLLYTRPVAPAILLSLVAQLNSNLTLVRQEADRLAYQLAELVDGTTLSSSLERPPLLDPFEFPSISSFALAWRPLEPLPEVLHIPLRRELERIALTNACVITFLDIVPALVHLVVTCPPGRDSAWAVHKFKQGSEEAIQSQFGVQMRLWDKGYYAIQSTEPLAEVELNLFVERVA